MESTSGLSQGDIARMRDDGERYAADDKVRREMLQHRAEAEKAIRDAEQALGSKKAASMDVRSIREAIDNTRRLMDGVDPTKLQLAMWQLDQVARPLLEPV
jgi:molecular chaperone DnaK (HSP70)